MLRQQACVRLSSGAACSSFGSLSACSHRTRAFRRSQCAKALEQALASPGRQDLTRTTAQATVHTRQHLRPQICCAG